MTTRRDVLGKCPGVVALALAACAHGRGTPAEAAEHPIVADVDIIGNEVFDDEAITNGLGTRETGRWPWSDVERVDPLAVATDERRIETFYALRGYHAADVEHEIVALGSGRARVVFRIREGQPIVIGSVEVTGLDSLGEALQAELRGSLPVRAGEVARYDAFEAARALLEYRLRHAGYLLAEVGGRIDVYPERPAAAITIDVEPGPLHRYGPIGVEGLAAYPADPIRTIARRVLPRGALASPSELEEAQARIFDLGAFRGVRVSSGAPPPGGGEAPIVVRADELPVHSVVMGGGIGVEQNLQQLRLVVGYGNTSVFGSAAHLSWRNEGALRFLPTFYDRERTGVSAESALEITRPEILRRTDIAVRGAYRRAFRDAYEANVLIGRVGFPHRFASGLRVVPALNYEWYLGFGTRSPAAGAAGLPLGLGCPAPCRIAYLSADLVLDRRNDPVATRRGAMLLVAAEYGVPLAESRFHFVRLEPEARAYVPLSSRLSLALRAKLGALLALGASDDSPLPHRFFGGGDGGHRGFGPEQLAPVVEDRSGGYVPIGGDGLWLATLELRQRVAAQWEAVSFADLGDVTIEPFHVNFGEAHLALGLGIRYFTLAGPVRLDIAYRLPRRERRTLDTGAAVEASWRDYLTFFLSLGEAF